MNNSIVQKNITFFILLILVSSFSCNDASNKKLAGYDWSDKPYYYTSDGLPKVNKIPKNSLKKNFDFMDLDLTIIPEIKDIKLFNSDLYISVTYFRKDPITKHIYFQDNTIYHGPYKDHLFLKKVPHFKNESLVDVVVEAYNKKEKLYYVWLSKDCFSVFINKPLIIELLAEDKSGYCEYLKIYPAEKMNE